LEGRRRSRLVRYLRRCCSTRSLGSGFGSEGGRRRRGSVERELWSLDVLRYLLLLLLRRKMGLSEVGGGANEVLRRRRRVLGGRRR